MGNKFGIFGDVESLNAAAEGLMKEGDKDSLFALAAENGIDKEDAEDYWDEIIEELVTLNSMAYGAIRVEKEQGNKNMIYNILYETLTGMLPDEELAMKIIAKSGSEDKRERSMADVYTTMMDFARSHGNAIAGTNKQLEKIIRCYYLAADANAGKTAVKEIIAKMTGGN